MPDSSTFYREPASTPDHLFAQADLQSSSANSMGRLKVREKSSLALIHYRQVYDGGRHHTLCSGRVYPPDSIVLLLRYYKRPVWLRLNFAVPSIARTAAPFTRGAP
jgi:hypothetical protein